MKYNTPSRQHYLADSNETEVIPPELIAGYIIQRSPTDKFKFNIMAVSAEDEFLFCAASDLTFEKASAMVEVVNQEHFPIVPSPTELVEVEIANQKRIFNAKKG